MTYQQAINQFPADAEWSCSFGNPGEGGYTEFHRDAAGNRYELANGPWHSNGKTWSIKRTA
jgi:hypothetical protein